MVSHKQKVTTKSVVKTHTDEVVELSELLVKYCQKKNNRENIVIRRLLEEELRVSLNCFLDDL